MYDLSFIWIHESFDLWSIPFLEGGGSEESREVITIFAVMLVSNHKILKNTLWEGLSRGRWGTAFLLNSQRDSSGPPPLLKSECSQIKETSFRNEANTIQLYWSSFTNRYHQLPTQTLHFTTLLTASLYTISINISSTLFRVTRMVTVTFSVLYTRDFITWCEVRPLRPAIPFSYERRWRHMSIK
jgi:hypothetical protein